MDPSQTIKLIEQWFMQADHDEGTFKHMRCDHLQIVDERLKGEGEEMLFKYLSTLITEKEAVIQEEHQRVMVLGGGTSPGSTSSSMSGLNPFSQGYQASTASAVCDYGMYKELMLRFVRCLLSIISDKRYRGMLSEFVKKKFVPLEESSQIIQDYLNT